MIKFVRSHPLLSGVAVAAIISGGLIVWLASLSGSSADDAVNNRSDQTTTTEPASSDEPAPTIAPESGQSQWPENASQTEQASVRDGVNPAIGRLRYSERVDSVATVNAGGRTWILSELPTDTRNRFFDDGLAGPDLDPFGGEILLVEDETILQAFPMNEFPPSFLDTDGVMVFGGRIGDGGYPDSALVGINALTLSTTRIALRLPETETAFTYGPNWTEGTDRQLKDMANSDYLQALNAMSGVLPEGDTWVVRSDPESGLCAAIADIDYGCDDQSVFVTPSDPSHTPRIIARPVPPEGIDHDAIGIVVFGYLPDGAVNVEIRIDGVALDVESSINEVLGMWVVPASVPNEDFSVAFVDDAGAVVVEWPSP